MFSAPPKTKDAPKGSKEKSKAGRNRPAFVFLLVFGEAYMAERHPYINLVTAWYFKKMVQIIFLDENISQLALPDSFVTFRDIHQPLFFRGVDIVNFAVDPHIGVMPLAPALQKVKDCTKTL